MEELKVEYKFVFPIAPVAQARPRATRMGKGIRLYDPQKVHDYKRVLNTMAKEQFKQEPLEGQLRVHLMFFREVQKSLSKKERQLRLLGDHRPTLKPDVDNYIKSTLDGLNGVIWTDDNEIVSIKADKFYSEDPRVEVYVEELRPEDSRWMEE